MRGRDRQQRARDRRRLRRPMRLRHVPRLCRARLVRQDGRAEYRFAGREHVELCRRGRVEFPPGVPDRDARREASLYFDPHELS
jgi:hypothetical protein